MKNQLLGGSLNPKILFDLAVYNKAFRLQHPNYFYPSGTLIFCGSQGSGKTLSAVRYVDNLMKAYPYAILCTNVFIKDYPFNARREGEKIVRTDNFEHFHTVVEYTGLDDLKYLSNGEYGVIYFIDELHLELNSLESKNIDVDIMVEISQQRKQRKHIVGTSQIYMRLAKPLREQIKDIVLCQSMFFNKVQKNVHINGLTSREENGELKADVIGQYYWFREPKYFNMYDTYAKMKRYNKEWNGKRRNSD